MRTGHFRLPERTSAGSKIITALSMLIIISGLYMTCYMLFFRTVYVDVTKDAKLLYSGESGSAAVKVKNENLDYNQRIQEFMNSIVYEVSPDQELENGDVITIHATYDEELAERYHIQPQQESRQVVVENLPQRLQSAQELSSSFLDMLSSKGEEYLKKNEKAILKDDVTSFAPDTETTLVSQERLYRLFLDAKSTEQKDKVIDIYAIEAAGRDEGSEEVHRETIYYMITYNEINTSLRIGNENIYGEKLIGSGSLKLEEQKSFESYINRKYAQQYEITYLDARIPMQETQEDVS